MAEIALPKIVDLGGRKVTLPNGTKVSIPSVKIDVSGIEKIKPQDLIGGNSVWVRVQSELRKLPPEKILESCKNPLPWDFQVKKSHVVDPIAVLAENLDLPYEEAKEIFANLLKSRQV